MSELLSFIQATEESFRKARLPSLYSDFSLQRKTNPDGYATNVRAWQRALAHAALAGHIPPSSSSSSTTRDSTGGDNGLNREAVLSEKRDHLTLRTDNALMAQLETTEFGRPVALQCVVDEALRSGAMMPLDTFLTSTSTPFRQGWLRLPSPPSVSQLVGWGMKQVRGLVLGSESRFAGTGTLRPGEFVIVDNIKQAAPQVLKAASTQHSSNADRIYSKELFAKGIRVELGRGAALSDTDIDVLLIFLSRDQNAILYDGKTIKFKSETDKSTSITHEDQTIASLKSLMSNLESQVTRLDARVKDLTQTAKRQVFEKNRILAQSTLRSKKLAAHNLQRRMDELYQLEQVYLKLEQAVDQVDMVQVMKDSAAAMRTMNIRVGRVETIESVVDELRDEMEKVDEFGIALNEAAPAIDEEELDDELEDMLRTEKALRDRKEEQLAKLESRAETEAEAELETSIGKLSKMSIEDEREDKDPSKEAQARRVPAE
ncbi:hypothetical protein AJ80_02152 [Polytolypa hystricis UAMH7299]|uniref:SNF7 family protein n=1 Tax=Polytolypa hystricis (strain UAMH7299) TaxID=1447883 RepID=A0A2B7YI00_POLH7|nr:hypothetical protein AJ80_02152 [Polytolypa hystricis UAMH7299]